MKINSLHINSFGKFQNYHIEFNDSLNVRFGENGSGKTTVMSFIKLMFYSDSSKSKDINKNLRLKYLPKNGRTMSGSVNFSYEGCNYCLERLFGETPNKDVVNLTNLTTATKCKVKDTVNIGEQFFGLSRGAFEKSIFINQLENNISSCNDNDELVSHLTSLQTDISDGLSVGKAISKIRLAKEYYLANNQKSGKGDKLRNDIAQLKSKLVETKKDEDTFLRLNEEKKEIKEKLVTIENNIDRYNNYSLLRDRISEMEKIKSSMAMLEKAEILKEKIREKENELSRDGYIIDNAFLENIKQKIYDIGILNDRISKLKESIQMLEIDVESLDGNLEYNRGDSIDKERQKLVSDIEKAEKILKNKEAEYNAAMKNFYDAKTELAVAQNEEKKSSEGSRAKFVVLFVLGCLCLVAGVLLGVFMSPLCLLLSLLGVAVMFVVFPKLKLPNDSETIEEDELGNKENEQSADENAELSEELQLKQNVLNNYETNCNRIKNEMDRVSSYINTQKVKLGDIDSSKRDMDFNLNSLSSRKSERQDDLFIQKKNLKGLEQSLRNQENALLSELSKYKFLNDMSQVKDTLNIIKEKIRELDNLKAQLRWHEENCDTNAMTLDGSEKLAEIKREFEEKGILVGDIPSSYDIQKKINECLATRDMLRNQLNMIATENFFSLKNRPSVSELEVQIKRKQQELNAIEDLCLTYDIAISVLEDTQKYLSKNFAPKLNNKVQDIFSKFVDDKYKNVVVSKNFDITVEQKDGTSFSWEYLSSGTQDQVYLALRIAMSQIISEEGESLPLILDDILVTCDEKRAKKIVDYLKIFSEETQVILFTCSKSLYDMF